MTTDLKWTTQKRKISELVSHEKNPRKMSEAAEIQLRKSLGKFDLAEIPAIDTDNTILAGHQRLRLLTEDGRGDEEIDVRVPNRQLTVEEREEYLVRSNLNTGEWDYAKLKEFDEDLLLESGFKEEDLLMGWGLGDAEGADVDDSRLGILAVVPPESPMLKERAAIRMPTIEDYQRVKQAIADGKIGPTDILKLL